LNSKKQILPSSLQIPYTLLPTDKLYFLHIPKTGGRSFEEYLKSKFQEQETIRFNVAKGYPEKIAPEIYINFRLFLGHLGYEFLHRYPGGKKPYWITMFREPVDRVVSYYYFFRNAKPVKEPHFFYYAQLLASSLDLHDFVENPESNMLVNNVQFRNLVNSPLLINNIHFFQLTETSVFDSQQMELIKHRLLDDCAFFGITERYQQSIELLNYTFNWEMQSEDQQILNITPDRPRKDELSEDTIKVIKEKNQMDTEIYKFAVELFNNRMDFLNQIQSSKK